MVCAGTAQAQAVTGAIADIGAGVANGTVGVVAVNEAAGLNNAQANQLTVTSGGSGMVNGTSSEQNAGARARLTNASAASASIGEGAFANASGAVMVNQAAGIGNTQSNSARIGTAVVGVETVSDGDLSAAAATNGGPGRTPEARGIREASIGSAAFRNATGLVQVNQTVGAGNATANSFVLRPPAGTLF
ncbi:hypothetical protein D1Y85_00560 [Paraburkholderia dinghuensis]|uniref:Adhesin n=1 Tax=Paraburkholderia dinghuensis TaxID=2305225 RepID=A0A3N6QBS1_9BURK|nr:hypothetical protein D1Y85_00560 [Paraburkholderia dinghuensis]